MRARLLLILIILFASCQRHAAQELPDTASFESHVHIQGSDTLPYRIYCSVKAEQAAESLPLVVFLHGAGERGNNNIDQLRNCIVFFLNDTVSGNYPFYLLVPQCPEEHRWVNTDWTLPAHTMDEQPTAEMQGVFYLIDSLVGSGAVDRHRVYISGISMGGFGVWDAIARRPETFAAAIAICGGGDTNQAVRMKDIPIHIFHGKKDRLVKFSRSEEMYKALKKVGNKHLLFTEYETIGHGCWNKAFSTPGLFEWLFNQVKDEEKE